MGLDKGKKKEDSQENYERMKPSYFSQFFKINFTAWVVGIQLRLSTLVASTFAAQSSYQPPRPFFIFLLIMSLVGHPVLPCIASPCAHPP